MNGLLSIDNTGVSAESKNPDYLSGYLQVDGHHNTIHLVR